MTYADFPYYQDFYIGTAITEAGTFRQAAERASDYLDMVTFGRLCDGIPPEYDTQVKRCCCALAEAICLYQMNGTDSADGGGAYPKTQETIGAYSVSYAGVSSSISALLDGDTAGLQDYLHSIAMKYLGRTGLLFRGVE